MEIQHEDKFAFLFLSIPNSISVTFSLSLDSKDKWYARIKKGFYFKTIFKFHLVLTSMVLAFDVAISEGFLIVMRINLYLYDTFLKHILISFQLKFCLL